MPCLLALVTFPASEGFLVLVGCRMAVECGAGVLWQTPLALQGAKKAKGAIVHEACPLIHVWVRWAASQALELPERIWVQGPEAGGADGVLWLLVRGKGTPWATAAAIACRGRRVLATLLRGARARRPRR